MTFRTPSISSRIPANVSQPPPASSRTAGARWLVALGVGVSTLKAASLVGVVGRSYALNRGRGAQGCCHHARGEVRTHRAGAISPLSVDAHGRARSECVAMAVVTAETHEALS